MHHGEPGSLTGLLTRESADLASVGAMRQGVVKGATLQGALAWLRPIDSIWWAWVQRYLIAADLPKMDLFYWSEDITNLPAGLVSDLLELTLENSLAYPGSLTVLSEPIDLGAVDVDTYLIAGLTDHLTHWQSCYRTASLLGSECEFILVSGGHLQAILRPPGGRAAGYRTADAHSRQSGGVAGGGRGARRELVGALDRVARRTAAPGCARRRAGWEIGGIG